MSGRTLAVTLTILLVSIPLSASSGYLELHVRSSLSHNPVHATVKGEGPESFTVMTSPDGNSKLELPPGDYRLEISAADYSTLRTHYQVEAGQTTRGGAYLDPETVPEEESTKFLASFLRPGYTLLHGYIVAADSGESLANAEVSIGGVHATTDSKGHFAISFPTPKPPVPDGMGTETLTYQRAGYKTLVIHDFSAATEEMGPVAIDLERGSGTIEINGMHPMQMPAEEAPRDDPAVPSLPL